MREKNLLGILTSALALGMIFTNPATASDVPQSSYSFERVIRIVPESNFYGSDYRSVQMKQYEDAEDCADLCRSESQCRAFTYVPAHVQAPTAMCWLKDSWGGLTKLVSDRRMTFGFVNTHTKIEGGDLRGSDYDSFELSPGPHKYAVSTCAQRCQDDLQCSSYTLVHGNHYGDGSNHRCWLKNSIPNASRASGMWSGYFNNRGLQ